MIVLILQIVLLMLQRRVMGRRPIAHETGYACRHNRRDTWAIFRTEGRITEAQFDAVMRPYGRHVRTWKLWMNDFVLLIYIYMYTYIQYITWTGTSCCCTSWCSCPWWSTRHCWCSCHCSRWTWAQLIGIYRCELLWAWREQRIFIIFLVSVRIMSDEVVYKFL